jgi:large subunit ribosomal protein L18
MRKKIKNEKLSKRQRRHMHLRNRLVGTPERPRVAVFRSSKHIYAQLVDDTSGRTLATVSSLKLDTKPQAAAKGEDEGDAKKKKKKGKKAAPAGTKVLQAREVGRLLAEVAKEKGITRIAFDRGGYLYHGRVAALAQSARENGLDF